MQTFNRKALSVHFSEFEGLFYMEKDFFLSLLNVNNLKWQKQYCIL